MPTTSLYIHWPFCKSKCPYCDFNSHVRETALDQADWQDAYLKELEYYQDFLAGKTISSIYFGGGTPSLMPPTLVEKLIDCVAVYAQVNDCLEVTLEGNPTSIEAEKLVAFKHAGINRVSLGVQALNESDLKFLGREHSVKESLNALEMAAKLFERYTFDLIYARPSQSLNAWEQELKQAMQFMKSHASLYQLTIEKGTPFYSQYQKGEFVIPDEGLAADMYELTNHMLAAQGLEAYEISNYAKPEHESQHNLNYWHYGDYIGIGAGAHGRLSREGGGKEATVTIHQPENWLKQVQQKGHGIQQRATLSRQEMLEEVLMFGLRLKDGILFESVEKQLGESLYSLLDEAKLNLLIKKQILVLRKGRIFISNKYRILLNTVIKDLC